MANYIVTGAAGFIGAAVAKKLIEYGHYVVTIDNLSTGYKENIPEGVDFIEGDCGDPNIIKKLPVKNYTAIGSRVQLSKSNCRHIITAWERVCALPRCLTPFSLLAIINVRCSSRFLVCIIVYHSSIVVLRLGTLSR